MQSGRILGFQGFTILRRKSARSVFWYDRVVLAMAILRAVQKTEVPSSPQVAEVVDSAFGVNLESVERMCSPSCSQKMDATSLKALSPGICKGFGEKVAAQAKIGSYRLIRILGQGGMGVVYEGFDDGLGRKVAIKVTQVDAARGKEIMAIFQREAQVVARLNHPNVVQVYAFGEEKGNPYLVMELLSSGSLIDLIKEDKPIGEAFLMGVAYEIAEGLSAAQDEGLLHGDIKPENILFDDKMHAKLVDFGIAAMQVSKESREVWGTPYYIAPEKVVERKNNHKCDIYSLGATLYHALAKRPPFDGVDSTEVVRAAIDGKPPPLSKFRRDIHPEVHSIIMRMMEKDTNLRYPNYKSIMSDIKRYLATVPRERLHRPSHIVVSGSKKLKKGTQKVTTLNSSVPSPFTTSSQPLANAVPNQPAGLFKATGAKAVLLVGCLVPLIGVLVYKDILKKKADEPRRITQAMVAKGALAPSSTNSQQVAQVVKGPAAGKESVSSSQVAQVAKVPAVGKESASSNQVAQAVNKPVVGKELARGVIKIGEKIQLGNQKGVQSFKMEQGDSLIVALWSTSEGRRLCGDFCSLYVTQLESKKTVSWTSGVNKEVGACCPKGLLRGSKFPVIERIDPVKKQGRTQSYMAEQMGIEFYLSKQPLMWQFGVSKAEHAPAAVFLAFQSGAYSLSGEILIRSGPDTGGIEWMVFTTRLD
jgi:serine/threonine protein kinase